MFPPFNPAIRPPSRSDRGRQTKNYFLPVPSGFSVQVFKAPTLPARPYPAKLDLDYRPMAREDSQSTQQSVHVPRQQESTRNLLQAPPPEEPAFAMRPHDYKPGRYAIHAGLIHDTYIYERSISSKSEYPYSPSDPINDCDSVFSVNAQISSDSSSSSVTDSPPNTRMLQIRGASPSSWKSSSPSPPLHNPRSMSTFPPGHSCPSCTDTSPPSRTLSVPGDYTSYLSRPLPTPPVNTRVRKDSILLASERSSPPDDTSYIRQHSTSRRHTERASLPNVDERGKGNTETQPSRSSSLKGSLSITIPPPPGLDIVHGDHHEHSVLDTEPVHDLPHIPHRRNSDGDQTQVLPPRPVRSNTAPLARSVRWCDDLICPSPILPSQRRKGWFNRRGDQLWRNDGSYKPPPAGETYPPDLDGYPEPGEGWQNEEGIRIDLNHRLIPKRPPRSVLKPTDYKCEDGIIAGYLTAFPSSPTSDDE